MAKNRAQILITAADETRHAFQSAQGKLTRPRELVLRHTLTLMQLAQEQGLLE